MQKELEYPSLAKNFAYALHPMNIPLFDPVRAHSEVSEQLEEAALGVLRSGRYILGDTVGRFESALSEYLEGRHVVAVSSGTDALVLALDAMGVGPKDEVITTAYTFVATAEAIKRVGATPIFCDIDPETWMLSRDTVEPKISSRTRAIIPVHLFGDTTCPDKLVKGYEEQILVLEDVAQALGARLGERKAGTIGAAAAFSFFPTKNLGGYGDGGAISVKEDALDQILRRMRVHGRGLRPYVSTEMGYNARLDALQAARLAVKLPLLDRHNEARRALASYYAKALNVPELQERLQLVAPDPKVLEGHVFHQYVIRVRAELRDQLREHLTKRSISSAIYYPVGLHVQEFLGPHQLTHGDLPNTEHACTINLALPIFPGLTESEQEQVVHAIFEFARKHSA